MKHLAPRLTSAVLSAVLLVGAAPAFANAPEATVTQALADKAAVGKARLRVWGFNVYDATLYTRGGFDAATRAAVRAEYLASLQRWARADGFALPGEFVLGVGERAPTP